MLLGLAVALDRQYAGEHIGQYCMSRSMTRVRQLETRCTLAAAGMQLCCAEFHFAYNVMLRIDHVLLHRYLLLQGVLSLHLTVFLYSWRLLGAQNAHHDVHAVIVVWQCEVCCRRPE